MVGKYRNVSLASQLAPRSYVTTYFEPLDNALSIVPLKHSHSESMACMPGLMF